MSTFSTAEQIDAAIASFFSSWNIFTTVLVLLLGTVIIYPLLTSQEPDTHPFLLARQSQVAPIRHPGESAVYRAIDIPHGYPLRSGLAIKDPGAPRWTAGRNGDLRDIWRAAVRGPVNEEGASIGAKGKILTILGTEKVVEHSLEDVTAEINTIGQYVKRNNGQIVAVCLSNSTEILAAVFAGAFYGFSTILLPHGLPQSTFNPLLAQTGADHLIVEAGTLDISSALSAASSLKNVIVVTNPFSSHIDWTDGAPQGITMTSWEKVVKARSANSTTPLPLDKDSTVPPVGTFSVAASGHYELTKYTSESLVSATSALLATLPRTHKLSSADTLLPTMSLTSSYALCWTLAALFSHATLALTSVASDDVDLLSSVRSLRPTIVLASPQTVHAFLAQPTTVIPSGIQSTFGTRSLQAGNLPGNRFSDRSLRNLRVLFIAQSPSTPRTSRLTSATLHSLRLHLGSKVALALTDPRVAGAVAQSNVLDYRDKGRVLCVGPPLSSVELHVRGEEDSVSATKPRGMITVKGPAVVGGQAALNVEAEVDQDYTLLLPEVIGR